jgi:hypothetical protein
MATTVSGAISKDVPVAIDLGGLAGTATLQAAK